MRRDGQHSGTLRAGALVSTAGGMLSIARRGVLIAVGGSAVLADASGRLLGRAGAAGEAADSMECVGRAPTGTPLRVTGAQSVNIRQHDAHDHRAALSEAVALFSFASVRSPRRHASLRGRVEGSTALRRGVSSPAGSGRETRHAIPKERSYRPPSHGSLIIQATLAYHNNPCTSQEKRQLQE